MSAIGDGILYQNASGMISQVAARNHVLTPDLTGCQRGFGLRIESTDTAPKVATVNLQNNSVRDYQKNGITVLGTNTSVQIIGSAVRGQEPTTGAAENGIHVGPGSAGTIHGNDVIDNVWAPAAIDNPAAANSGILIFAARSVNVTSNIVGNNQFGIAAESSDAGIADGALIGGNAVFGTRIFDGIELCSNTNTVSNRALSGSGRSRGSSR